MIVLWTPLGDKWFKTFHFPPSGVHIQLVSQVFSQLAKKVKNILFKDCNVWECLFQELNITELVLPRTRSYSSTGLVPYGHLSCRELYELVLGKTQFHDIEFLEIVLSLIILSKFEWISLFLAWNFVFPGIIELENETWKT